MLLGLQEVASMWKVKAACDELQLATCTPPTTQLPIKHAACIAHRPMQKHRFFRTADGGEKHERSQQAAGSPSNGSC